MITIKFGIDNEVRKTIEQYPTTGAILRDAALRTVLGFGDNTVAMVGGTTVESSYALRDGDVVELVTRANSKGC